MSDLKGLLELSGKVIKELGRVYDILYLSYNSGYIKEPLLSILNENSVTLSGSSPLYEESKKTLKQFSKVKENDVVICEGCNTVIELWGDEILSVVENKLWMEAGCPYCGNTTLTVLRD